MGTTMFTKSYDVIMTFLMTVYVEYLFENSVEMASVVERKMLKVDQNELFIKLYEKKMK